MTDLRDLRDRAFLYAHSFSRGRGVNVEIDTSNNTLCAEIPIFERDKVTNFVGVLYHEGDDFIEFLKQIGKQLKELL